MKYKKKPENREEYLEMVKSQSLEWLSKNIYPFVLRKNKETEESYLKRASLFAYAKDLKP